jgi:CHASE3 domain sensor protein
MKLRVKIALGFGALLLILGLEGLVGYTSFVEMDRLSSEAEHSADLRRLARDMNLQLEREVSAVRGFLLSGNAKILDSYNDASQKFEKDSAEIDRLHPTEQAEALHNKIQKLRAAFEGAAEK